MPTSVAAVWKLEDTVEDDLIDDDQLLDEEDLKKPDPASLKGSLFQCEKPKLINRPMDSVGVKCVCTFFVRLS